MKVVCINNGICDGIRSNKPLKLNKVYEVLKVIQDLYLVINDKNEEGTYLKKRFILFSEYRNNKIKRLL